MEAVFDVRHSARSRDTPARPGAANKSELVAVTARCTHKNEETLWVEEGGNEGSARAGGRRLAAGMRPHCSRRVRCPSILQVVAPDRDVD